MRFALRLSIAVCPVATLMYYFNLPHGFWMPMTILVLILPYWENTLRKIADRVIGTLLGIAVFAILYYLVPKSFGTNDYYGYCKFLNLYDQTICVYGYLFNLFFICNKCSNG